MKYQVSLRGQRLEAVGAHSGYRIRMSTLAAPHLAHYPVHVAVRGSESEDEVTVDVPRHDFTTPHDAFDHGYECATLWIDALGRRDPIA